MFEHLFQDAVTLFVIIDPIALVPLFLALTHSETSDQRQKIALRAVLLSAIVLLTFIILGQFILSAIDISLEAFQIGGGLVLAIIGLKMVFDDEVSTKPTENEDGKENTPTSDVAVFPLATPFIAGPGSIMTVVLLTDNAKFSILDQLSTTSVMLIILAFTYGILTQADKVLVWLGDTGTNLVTRILGLLVVGIAIQTILTGINSFFKLSHFT